MSDEKRHRDSRSMPPSRGIVDLLRGDTAGGVILRRLLPVALLLPPVLGWVRVEAQEAGVIGAAGGVALLALMHVLTLVAVTLSCARAVSRHEDRRNQAIEALRQREAALRESHLMLRTTERIAHVGGFELDFATDTARWSEESFRMFGVDPETFAPTGTAFLSLVHPDDRAPVRRATETSLEAKAPFDCEYRIVRPDGEERTIHAQCEVVVDERDSPVRMVGTVHDVSDQRESEIARRKAEAAVAHLAMHDGLTGMSNRTVFVGTVQQAIARARRGGPCFAVLYLDLDHFKDVNDTLGHPVGDLLLQQVAERLRAEVREADLVARFGGDEFAVIAFNAGEPTQVAELAQRLHNAISSPFSIEGNDVRTGTSIGMAMWTPDVADPETLLSQADLALYRAKSDGRGVARFFAEGMDAEVRARVAMAADLREGIHAGQLFLVYQPQVEVSTGRIVGLEALVRWRHPRRGIVSPADFIPVAERTGLIVPLGRWVMRAACRQAKIWLDDGIAPEVMAVNVSGAQFRTPLELETCLAGIFEETKLPPERLEVELTETVLMDAWLEQRDVLLKLRSFGVKIAIDDFGTGFSSLAYLGRFPVDRIKIDRTFVSNLGHDRSNEAIVRATLGLARELGLNAIAEGVETRAELDLLREWRCGEVQGYFFAKPAPADEVEPLLRKGSLAPLADEPHPAPGHAAVLESVARASIPSPAA